MGAEVYALKPVSFLKRRVHILMQNENGPCPLLSLCNVLLLRNQLQLPADCVAAQCISAEQLIHRFAEKLLDSNTSHAADPNARKVIDDAIALLPNLNQGLDVNVRFCSSDGVLGFEYTAEFALFDLLDVTLAHGWLVDPEDRQATRVMDGMTYNHAVERLIALQSPRAPSPGLTRELSGCNDDPHQSSGSLQGHASSNDGETASAIDLRSAEEQMGSPSPCSPTETPPPVYSSIVAAAATAATTTNTATAAADALSPSAEQLFDPAPSGVKQVSGNEPPVAEHGQERSASSANVSTPIVSSAVADGMVVEAFFRDSASQLTYHGLLKLHQHLAERQLCVFFRNNHFSTMFKINGKLYLLVTDVGYLKEPNVVWEKLDEIDGDTEYVTGEFGHIPATAATSDQLSIDPDYLLALQMQSGEAGPSPPHPGGVSHTPQPSEFMPAQALPAAQATLSVGSGVDRRDVIPASSVQPLQGYQPTAPLLAAASAPVDDEALARQLQASFDRQARSAPPLPSTTRVPMTDEQLALRLQRELDREEARQWETMAREQRDAETEYRRRTAATRRQAGSVHRRGSSAARASGESIGGCSVS